MIASLVNYSSCLDDVTIPVWILSVSPKCVYRKDAVEMPEALLVNSYPDEDAHLEARTMLSGKHYKIDNKLVFTELEALMTCRPAWAFIKKFKEMSDGQKAMLT